MPKKLMLPFVLGVCDGVLSTLVLAAGRLTNAAHPITLSFAIRIALVTFSSGAFVFFVAKYAELRGQLIGAERQLNMRSYGKLATGALGRAIRQEALLAAAGASCAGFCGALIPLLVATVVPQYRWASILASLVALAILAATLAHVVHGAALRWVVGLVLGGLLLVWLGFFLRIVA